jgi:hypothetical protein
MERKTYRVIHRDGSTSIRTNKEGLQYVWDERLCSGYYIIQDEDESDNDQCERLAREMNNFY